MVKEHEILKSGGRVEAGGVGHSSRYPELKLSGRNRKIQEEVQKYHEEIKTLSGRNQRLFRKKSEICQTNLKQTKNQQCHVLGVNKKNLKTNHVKFQ